MERIKASVKGVDSEAWDMLRQLRIDESRFMGAILSDCIRLYWEDQYEEELEAD